VIPKSVVKWKILYAAVVCIPNAITVALLVAGVWLPDFARSPFIVQSVTLASGAKVELIQNWVSDGYATLVRETSDSGVQFSALGDPDARRIWKAKIEVNTTTEVVTLFFNSEKWRYSTQGHVLDLGHGKVRYAQ
jgi:hypothetical protein